MRKKQKSVSKDKAKRPGRSAARAAGAGGSRGPGGLGGSGGARASAGALLPPPSTRDAKAAARREAILDAALDEFSARGFAAARLDDVARRAGVAKGTIYLYFADKERLFEELIRSKMMPVVGRIEAIGSVDLPLRAVLDQLAEIFVRDVVGTRRSDLVRLILNEGPRFPALAEFYYRDVLSRGLGAVRAMLRRARARGELSDDTLLRFPQLLVAPGIIALVWSALFERFEPLDVLGLMRANFDRLLPPRSGP